VTKSDLNDLHSDGTRELGLLAEQREGGRCVLRKV
jgi:hypothetical protein